MLKIEKDGIYRTKRVRSGTGERGDWQLVVVADDQNDKRTVTIFVENVPCGAIEGQQVKIKEIVSVKIGWKRDQNQQWKNVEKFHIGSCLFAHLITSFSESVRKRLPGPVNGIFVRLSPALVYLYQEARGPATPFPMIQGTKFAVFWFKMIHFWLILIYNDEKIPTKKQAVGPAGRRSV